MRPSISLYLFALLFFFQSSTIAALTTLEQLCNNLGGSYVTPDYCLKTLKADPASATADAQGLGIIAVKLTIAKATTIEELLKNQHGDKAVEACHQLYSDLIPSLKWAANSMTSKSNRAAEAALNSALSVPARCDGLGVPRITNENNALSDLIILARGIANYLAA